MFQATGHCPALVQATGLCLASPGHWTLPGLALIQATGPCLALPPPTSPMAPARSGWISSPAAESTSWKDRAPARIGPSDARNCWHCFAVLHHTAPFAWPTFGQWHRAGWHILPVNFSPGPAPSPFLLGAAPSAPAASSEEL